MASEIKAGWRVWTAPTGGEGKVFRVEPKNDGMCLMMFVDSGYVNHQPIDRVLAESRELHGTEEVLRAVFANEKRVTFAANDPPYVDVRVGQAWITGPDDDEPDAAIAAIREALASKPATRTERIKAKYAGNDRVTFAESAVWCRAIVDMAHVVGWDPSLDILPDHHAFDEIVAEIDRALAETKPGPFGGGCMGLTDSEGDRPSQPHTSEADTTNASPSQKCRHGKPSTCRECEAIQTIDQISALRDEAESLLRKRNADMATIADLRKQLADVTTKLRERDNEVHTWKQRNYAQDDRICEIARVDRDRAWQRTYDGAVGRRHDTPEEAHAWATTVANLAHGERKKVSDV